MAERNMNVEMTDDHDDNDAAKAACHETQRTATEWEQRLAGDILKEVSRSFYLTLKSLFLNYLDSRPDKFSLDDALEPATR